MNCTPFVGFCPTLGVHIRINLFPIFRHPAQVNLNPDTVRGKLICTALRMNRRKAPESTSQRFIIRAGTEHPLQRYSSG